MADDRQPPQAYDTVSPAGVGATATNQVSPGTIQEILDTGSRDLIEQAMEQMPDDDFTRYLESLPDLPPLVWPVQTSSLAGVGSQGSQSFRSIQTSPGSSPATPLSRGSARISSGARTPASHVSVPLAAAAGAGGDRRGPRIMVRGGRGGGRGGAGGGRGGGGAGGAGGAGGGGGGGGGGNGCAGGGVVAVAAAMVVVVVVVVVDEDRDEYEDDDDDDDEPPFNL